MALTEKTPAINTTGKLWAKELPAKPETTKAIKNPISAAGLVPEIVRSIFLDKTSPETAIRPQKNPKVEIG
jgi:hypothetical protein